LTKAEGRRQKAEGRRQKAEGRRQGGFIPNPGQKRGYRIGFGIAVAKAIRTLAKY